MIVYDGIVNNAHLLSILESLYNGMVNNVHLLSILESLYNSVEKIENYLVDILDVGFITLSSLIEQVECLHSFTNF